MRTFQNTDVPAVQKILNWINQIPKKIHDYYTLAEIAHDEFNDYEKFF